MKKAQASLVGTLVVFALIFLVFMLFYTNLWFMGEKSEDFNDLKSSSRELVVMLKSEGFPNNWGDTNVIPRRPGLMEGNTISLKKLEAFSKINYSTSKKIMGFNYDYMITVEDITGYKYKIDGLEYLGWNGYLMSYGGNGASDFDFFFDVVKDRAKHIIKQKVPVYFKEKERVVNLVVYAWKDIDFKFGRTECSDGIDNDVGIDMDDLCDMPRAICTDAWASPGDLGCLNWLDDNESNPPFELKCSIRQGHCALDEGKVIGLSKGVFGRHAYLPNESAPYYVCCSYKNYFAMCFNGSCGADYELIGNLEKERNAHFEDKSGSVYPIALEIGPTAGVGLSCNANNGVGTDCGAVGTCIFRYGGENHNLHIDDCASNYDRRVCCKFN